MGSENGWGRRFPGKRAGVPDRDNSGKSSKGKRVLVLVMVWAWVFCAWGCDRQARHQVLTFFFTGVPPLEEEKPKEQAVARPSAIKKKKE
ncbi:MAG: hypothetical protein GY849_16850, partial [Deltaproteobacteria bacterium]|nr:hypothetical protein [Deltaproteobacteria bacterium]